MNAARTIRGDGLALLRDAEQLGTRDAVALAGRPGHVATRRHPLVRQTLLPTLDIAPALAAAETSLWSALDRPEDEDPVPDPETLDAADRKVWLAAQLEDIRAAEERACDALSELEARVEALELFSARCARCAS